MTPVRIWLAATVVACALVNPYVRGDGNGYYAWLVSPVIDGDLDFTNQFRRADPSFQSLIFDEQGQVRPEARTSTGLVINQWSVGPAVLWAPWFVTAHAAVLGARAVGADLPADGYSWPYLWAVAIGTVVYGSLALWWSVTVAVQAASRNAALQAAGAIALASSLPVYQVFLPFHVHALAACTVAAFVAYWHRWLSVDAPGGAARWAAWGGLAGVMVQVYHLNGLLLPAAVWYWLREWRHAGAWSAIGSGVAFAGAGLFVCLPQLIGKAAVYGHPLATGYLDRFIWWEPRVWQTALSANHGWLSWTPVVVPAIIGLVILWRRGNFRPWLVCAGVFYLAVASYQNWHGQSSFGNRFFVSLTVLLVMGLAVVIDRVAARGPAAARALALLLVALAVWNAGFVFQWGTNIIPNRGPVDWRVVAVNQVTVVPTRLVAFGRRYLISRQDAQAAVGAEDERERRDYQVVR